MTAMGEDRSLSSEGLTTPQSGKQAKSDQDGPAGKPYTLFESGAILLYLCLVDTTGRFLPKDPVAKFDAIQWMMVQMTLVGPMFGQYVHFMSFAPKGNDYALDRYRVQVRRVLATLEERLGVVPFLGGQSCSIADIADLSLGTRGRHLPRQGGRGRPPEADGLGRHDQQPSGGNPRLGHSRRGAGEDDGVRQDRRRRQRPPL
jgi:glutathione S-transferase